MNHWALIDSDDDARHSLQLCRPLLTILYCTSDTVEARKEYFDVN